MHKMVDFRLRTIRTIASELNDDQSLCTHILDWVSDFQFINNFRSIFAAEKKDPKITAWFRNRILLEKHLDSDFHIAKYLGPTAFCYTLCVQR